MNGQTFIDALRTLEEGEDVAPLAGLHSEEATIWNPQMADAQQPTGRDGAERFWSEYRAAFRTIRSEFLSVTDADGRSFLEWESTGEMPDGSPFSYRGVSIVEWDGDRIRRFATYFNPSALPAVPQRTDEAPEAPQRAGGSGNGGGAPSNGGAGDGSGAGSGGGAGGAGDEEQAVGASYSSPRVA